MKDFIHEAEASFEENANGLYIARHQVITDDFLTDLNNERIATANVRAGEHMKVASVPTSVWELWQRQGRDPQNASARQIVQWLRADNLHAFIATEKRV